MQASERKSYIAANWVREDKELGMLPLNLLSEIKLPRVKTIICFA